MSTGHGPLLNKRNLCFSAATALVEGKIGKRLKKVLKKVAAKEAHEQLAISDVKLGGVIKVRDPPFTSLRLVSIRQKLYL